jgi:hypothetical protein
MKAKLIKTDVNYILEDDKGVVIASTSLKRVEGLSLSLKNCQVIERGYDLDELTENFWKQEFIKPGIIDTNSFKQGFQKALELMGDKKYNREFLLDIIPKVIQKRLELTSNEFNDWYNSEFLKMIFDRKEWDVEVETVPALSNNGNVYYGDIPKLDADGCLILKRI